MARKPARGKARTRKTSRKRATRARSRTTARAKRSVRRARPRKAAAKTRAKAKRPARKRVTTKRASAGPRPKPAAPTLGQIPLGSYTTPQPVSPLEPMRHDPWDRPVEHTHEEGSTEDEEEDEEPL